MATKAQIHERYIEYAANLLRVDASTRRKVFILLRKVEDELIAALNQADPVGVVRDGAKQARLNQLLKQTRAMLDQQYKRINSAVIDDLKDLAKVEELAMTKIVNDVIGVEILATHLNPQLIKELVSNTLIVGAPSAEWWARQSYSTQRRFADEIRKGMMQGETLTELSQRIRGKPTGARAGYKTASGEQRFRTEFSGGIMDISRREADALVRSSVQAVSQAARFSVYEHNNDVIDGVQALVTLDSRTTDICKAISGQAWLLDGTPIGNSGPWRGPPPYHYNCRTTLIPILKSWEDLAPAHKKALARKADQAGKTVKSMQSSMDGPVSAELDYESWLKTKPAAFQRELLGPTKYELWKAGKITFRDLVDQSGNPLTVAELKARFG